MSIQTRLVDYHDGDTILEGMLAWDDTRDGQRPGVMVSHAWAGRGAFEDQKAQELAKLGYVMAYKLLAQLPNARLRVLPDAMHSLPTERPWTCARLVRDFVRSDGAGWQAYLEIREGGHSDQRVAHQGGLGSTAARRRGRRHGAGARQRHP